MDTQSTNHSTTMAGIEEAHNAPANVNVVRLPEQFSGRQWKMHELCLLIAAKRLEHEFSLNNSSRERIRTTDQKWRDIQSALARDGVLRVSMQIKKRWEKLVTDFKKVYDYQNHVGSGQPSYYEMASEERKTRKLPVNFAHELFESMEPWMGTQRAINPSPNQVVDTGNVQEEAHIESEQTPEGPASEILGNDVKVDSPPPVRMEPSSIGADAAQRRTPPIGLEDRGIKKSRRDRLDNQFKKTSANFLEFLGKDSERKSRLEETNRNWEKDRHDSVIALDLKKHQDILDQQSKILDQQSKMTDAMANAIGGISDSIRFFATEIARR